MYCCCSVMSDSLQPMDCNRPGFLSFISSQSLLKLISIGSMMLSKYLILCHPLLLLPSGFPSIRLFSNEWALHIRWPKYWSFSFSISLSNDYSGLISFWIDWFDFFAVQRTLKSLLPHHSFEHQFLDTQPSLWSNLHICTWLLGKIIALTTDFCGQSEISAFEYAI